MKNTYKFTSTSIVKLEALCSNPRTLQAIRSRFRLVILTGTAIAPEEAMGCEVLDHYQGDCFEDWQNWATRTAMDEVVVEHMALKKLPTPSQKKRAIASWLRAQQSLKDAERDVLRAKANVEKRSRTMLKTFGRGPVNVEGDLYDPSFIRESIVYLRRPGQ